MKGWVIYSIWFSVLAFLFAYSWYLPANHFDQLVLDLSTDTAKPGILLSDALRIEQSFVVAKDSNQIIIPLQIHNYAGEGVMHIGIKRTDTNASVATNQEEIKNNQDGDVTFNFSHIAFIPSQQYIAILSFSGVQEQDNIRIPYAFGKYSNLSGTVNQYLYKNNNWKLRDTRHGNIAVQFYYSPQENNLALALKTFILPAIAICILFSWIMFKLKNQGNNEIILRFIHWKEYCIAACLGLVFAGISTAPLYIHLSYISNHGDINRGLVYSAIAHRDLLRGHLPYWNQYICGGSPLWGDLESWFLQPFFLLTLPFSAVIAMKLMYTLCLAAAFLGFYIFARRILDFKIFGSGMFAFIMAFSGYLSGHLAEGYYVWIASAWVPWFLLFSILSLKNIKYAGPAGMMLAFMFLSGSMHMVVFSLLFIGIVFLFQSKKIKISRRCISLLFIVFFFIILAAIKLLPTFSVLTANISREGFAPSLQELPNMLLARGTVSPLTSNGQTIRWAEFGAYTGYGVFLLACIGAIIWKNKIWNTYKAYLVASAIFLCISFISLPIAHGFLSHITDLFRMPSRVIWFGIFGIALVSGFAIDNISGSRIKFAMTLCIISFIAIDLLSNNIVLFSRTFSIPIPELHAESTFQRVSHAYSTHDELYYRAIYIDFLENRGTNDVCRFYQAGPFTRTIDSTDPRSRFMGEVALRDPDSGTVSYTMNDQSEYTIHATVTSPTTILVNQNYYPGWKTDSKLSVKNTEGIIGIHVMPGAYNFSLLYKPYAVYWGAIISMIGIVLGVLLLLYE
ncbi:MAG TPA: hypothetical protein VLG69_05060 [Candidatus Andersenbacteria bacterium]|nr:hypothetical protein [Candidatus Andersenbacteria bacterium]